MSTWIIRSGHHRGVGDYLVEIGYLPRILEWGHEQRFAHRFTDRNAAKGAALSCIRDGEPARIVRLRAKPNGGKERK